MLMLLLLLGGAAVYLFTRESTKAPLSSATPPPVQQLFHDVVLPRATLGAYGSFEEPGQPAWDLARDPDLVAQHGEGRSEVLVLRCNCGKIIRLLDHQVAQDGRITPSIWHDIPDCGWHVYGRLDGWEQGEWSAGQQ